MDSKVMDKDINCRNFKGLFAYLLKNHGERGIREVTRGLVDNDQYLLQDKYGPSTPVPVQVHHLTDSAYWVSNEFSLNLLGNVKRVVRGPNPLFRAGAGAVKETLSRSVLLAGRLLGPKFLATQAARLNSRFNRTKEVYLIEFSDHSATFELRYDPRFRVTKDVCNWNLGIYVELARSSGVTHVKGKEVRCRVDGDECCLFRLSWKRRGLMKRTVQYLIGWSMGWHIRDLTSEHQVTLRERDALIERLTLSEERYRDLADSLPDVIFETDITGRLTFVNRNTFELFGYGKKEFDRGVNVLQMLIPEDRNRAAENIRLALAGQRPEVTEYTALKSDGTTFPIEIHSEPVVRDGKPSGLRGILIDGTERRRAEEERARLEAQLHQAQKMEAIGTLAGGMAHEFNNILGIIMGNAELAMIDTPEGGHGSAGLQEIMKASFRARDIVKQLLSFSRKVEVRRKLLKADPIIREALTLVRASIPSSIDIRQKIHADTFTILADPTQLNQVLFNLCMNAADAMEEGGALEITLQNLDLEQPQGQVPAGKYVRLTVSDTGTGIPSESLDRIFDPFFTTKAVGKGAGMGLALVHGIVRAHDGMVTVESIPGSGTTFHVYLPAVEGEPAKEQDPLSALPKGNERVLFVDDEESIAALGKVMLERLGYEVETRTDPVEALELFRADPERFHVVVTDTTMPKMTGDRLVQELRKRHPGVRIVICTGYSERMDEEEAKRSGINAYLMKPLDLKALATTVRKVLDEK